MDAPEDRLIERARRAYEVGRFWFAARRSALLIPVVALALLGCNRPAATLACGALLLLVVAVLLWRGREYGRGVTPGLAAGALPLLLPIVARASGHFCVSGACILLPSLCLIGGVSGGLALALLTPRPRDCQGIAFLAATLVAALAGSLGCLLYGFLGLAVMIAGLVAGALPVLALRRA